jgi:hypothetical protein
MQRNHWIVLVLFALLASVIAGWCASANAPRAAEPRRHDAISSTVRPDDRRRDAAPAQPGGAETTNETDVSLTNVATQSHLMQSHLAYWDRLRAELPPGDVAMQGLKYLVVDDALRADLNNDEWLDGADMQLFIEWIERGDECADFDKSGEIDTADMAAFVRSFQDRELIDVPNDKPRPRC